jgi:Protein of unknown function (DUF2630)
LKPRPAVNQQPPLIAKKLTGVRTPICGFVGTRPTLVRHTGLVEENRKPTDRDTLARIHHLVAEEKSLRERLQHGDISASEEHERLRRVETELDQCWDLLRQRRALRETGGDPRAARVRPPDEVEGYLG